MPHERAHTGLGAFTSTAVPLDVHHAPNFRWGGNRNPSIHRRSVVGRASHWMKLVGCGGCGCGAAQLPQKKCDTTIYRELPTVRGEKVRGRPLRPAHLKRHLHTQYRGSGFVAALRRSLRYGTRL
jgi:hypothetical protein